MHDIDRTIDELELETEGGYNEFEYEDEGDLEYLLDDDSQEEYEYESPFDESEEMELATELLSVSNDEELEEFLGKLFKKVGRFFKRAVRSPIFRRVGGFLKKVAKKALPIAGTALGGFFGGPVGGSIGRKLGSFASRLFELELEGLSPEDQEFEVAKKFVRFAGAVAKNAALAPLNVSPNAVVKAAIKSAAKKHAPGLIRKSGLSRSYSSDSKNSGRWIRRGRKIILDGA